MSKIITGDLDCSHAAIQDHGHDGSPYAVYPQAVLYPKTTGDIKHAIAFAREYHIPLTVCGGLTASTGGALSEGITLDMTRYFSHIRHVNMLENTVTVDAGVRIDDLKARLASWGMELPVLNEEYSDATIGGLLATKSATPSTFYAGTIREWIEGLTVVVDSGEEHHLKDGVTPSGRLLGIYQSVFPLLSEAAPVLRASRRELSDDATGYSLWNTSIGPRQLMDQLVGSEGTLAIITSVTLRVVPLRIHSLSAIIPIPRVELIETYTNIARHHRAESMYMIDATFRKLTDTLHSNLISTTIPETPCALIVTWKGNDEHEMRLRIQTCAQAFPEKEQIHFIENSIAQKLSSSAFLHSLFKDYSKGSLMISTAGEGLIVPPRVYAEFVSDIDEKLASTGRLYTITGCAGSGHVAVTVAFDAQSPSYEEDLQVYKDMIFLHAAEYKGGLSASGGDGLERTTGLPLVYNEATRSVFKKLKECWDPLSIFNPGKKLQIGGDFLVKRIIRKSRAH